MGPLFSNVLTASFHGSIVILAVLLLRFLLRKAPRKYICFLSWLHPPENLHSYGALSGGPGVYSGS